MLDQAIKLSFPDSVNSKAHLEQTLGTSCRSSHAHRGTEYTSTGSADKAQQVASSSPSACSVMGHAMPPLPQPGQDTRANNDSCLLLLLFSPRAGLVAGRTMPCKARLRAVQQLPLALCAAEWASLLQQLTLPP